MKHLNDELILSWISGDLAEDQLAMAKKHVDDCNTCFLRFSVLLKSQKDITSQSLEKAPNEIINQVRSNLGLELTDSGVKEGEFLSGPIPLPDEIIDQSYGKRLFATLTKPGPVLYSLTTAVAVVLILITIIRNGAEVDDDIEPSKIIERFTQPRIMDPASKTREISGSKEEITGFQVNLENNILKITQPFRFKRELKVYSEKGDLILETEFTDAENSFTLHLENTPSIRVVISSLDKIVFEQSISLIQQK